MSLSFTDKLTEIQTKIDLLEVELEETKLARIAACNHSVIYCNDEYGYERLCPSCGLHEYVGAYYHTFLFKELTKSPDRKLLEVKDKLYTIRPQHWQYRNISVGD